VTCPDQLSATTAEVKLPGTQHWPSITCTAQELERLRVAYRNSGATHEVVARQVQRADQSLRQEIGFPPEGGQHNQWYQCDRCQIALKTLDDTHHECPECGEVYSGYPYDNVIYSRRFQQLTNDLRTCAWAHALTEEENYATHARDILIGFAERYTTYPYHSANQGKRSDKASKSGAHVFEQTLTEASWIHGVCEAYDLVRLSDEFSAQDHRKIREDFLLPVYRNIDKHRAGKSNWQTYHNAAFMAIGGVLHDADLIRQALEDPENGFYYQMDVSVLPGGMWYENSWGYHFYTLAAVERILEISRRLGIDLYGHPRVKSMYTVALDYRMVDGTLPRFGDATTTGIPAQRYESAHAVWGDADLLSVLSPAAAPMWDSILYGREESASTEASGAEANSELESYLKEGAGHAILRADGPAGPSSAVMTFGPFGGFHGHFDKLSFVYFALGQELGYDPGRARSQAYRLPIHRNWYRATTSHNTVLVDRASQEGVAGQHECFVQSNQMSAAGTSVHEAYANVLHNRLILLRPEFLIVADIMESTDGTEHVYDWLYHNRGRTISSPMAVSPTGVPEGQGFEYLEDVLTGTTDVGIRATVQLDEGEVDVIVDAQRGTDVLIGTGVGESITDRVPLIAVTRRGPSALFAAVIEPRARGVASQVKSVAIRAHESGGHLVTIELADGQEIYRTTGALEGISPER
jgi:hypothetical protein